MKPPASTDSAPLRQAYQTIQTDGFLPLSTWIPPIFKSTACFSCRTAEMSLWFRNDVFSPATGLLSGGQAPRHVLDAQGVDVRLNEAAAQRDLVPDRRITCHLLFERANYPVERFGIDAEPTLRPLTIGRS